jgi:DNA segregation ATPase FtsK/SpoIIIE-like protein
MDESPYPVSLGIGSSGPYRVDLDSESPHILVNAPTGLGKSAVARTIAVQRLSMGDLVVVLDRKMHSHKWARGLTPVVHYADDTPSIGAALINLGRELSRRNAIVRDFDGDESDAPVGPRIVVIFEETNATLSQLKALDRSSAQGHSSSMDAFADLLFMGRSVKMHVIAFAQLASYRSGLTADLLENFGTRILIGYSDKAWKWLASDCGRYRVAPVGTGRGMVCHQGRASEVQLAFMPKESAAEYVLDSIPAQRRARELSGSRRNLPPVWRTAITR